MSHEFQIVYRPKSWKRVIGQPDAVAMLDTFVRKNKVPHAMTFTGPSGCGKTTLARLLKDKIGCLDTDFKEYNTADFNGINTIRSIRRQVRLSPDGDIFVYLIDEAHQLTSDAQDAFLKLLEDTPEWVYFFLATTDPDKLKATVRTRCTEIKVRLLSPGEIKILLKYICKKEGRKVSNEVMTAISDASEGSPRSAVKILSQVIRLKTEKAQLNAVVAADSKLQATKVLSALLTPNIPWESMCKILKLVGDEPEKVRRYILAAATNIMLSGSKASGKAYGIINAFRDPFYESQKAGLVAACWEARGAK